MTSTLEETVETINKQLEDAATVPDREEPTLTVLKSISELAMTPALLRSLSIARTVGKLRKSPVQSVSALATVIVSSWKRVLENAPAMRAASSVVRTDAPPHISDLDLFSALSGSSVAYPILNQFTDNGQSIDDRRMRVIQGAATTPGHVVYWMSRDQRVSDNWALLKAQQVAIEKREGLAIAFCLSSSFLGANKRHFGFMLRGLKELEGRAASFNIPLYILCGAPEDVLPKFISDNNVSTVVCDFSPLRIAKQWKATVRAAVPSSVQIVEVDTHNIAPCFKVSDKCEFSARTIRSKIHNAMETYLTEFPPVVIHPHPFGVSTEVSGMHSAGMWNDVNNFILPQLDASVKEIDWIAPGEAAAWRHMCDFIPRLKTYGDKRNDPTVQDGVSNLSPYFHFGHLSVQRVLLEIKRAYKCGIGALFPSGERTTGIHSFCEEAVVRKELSDNFCNYNSKYDSIEGAHEWAQKTLREHWNDARSTLYSLEQLEGYLTGDPLWNAAQREMVGKGKMHGFMRMYWAKKVLAANNYSQSILMQFLQILEWSPDPSEALKRAIYLNDKYSIDGRDPNGFVGCMWAIAGVHDRAWGKRPVFGTIRYMNYEGCKRKFDIAKYMKLCSVYSKEDPCDEITTSATNKTVRLFSPSAEGSAKKKPRT